MKQTLKNYYNKIKLIISKKIIKNKKYNEDEILYTGPRNLKNNDVVKLYVEDLEKALNNRNIHHIALSGWYGSGKSSIVHTFLKKNKRNEKESLVISLGSILSYDVTSNDADKRNKVDDALLFLCKFKEGLNNTNLEGDKKIESKNDTKSDNRISLSELEIVDKIEKSILKQIVHYNFSDEMPRSSIKRLSSNILIKYILIYLIFNIVIFLMCINNVFIDALDSVCLFKVNVFTEILYLLSIFISIYLILDYFYDKLSGIELKKIKLKNNELEFGLFESLTFNRSMYEILYFFQKNEIKNVFFEDLDRFDNDIVLMVMEELKELNSIINSSAFANNKKYSVKFIYEFKDDIFEDYEKRNKFYDYVISLMPLSTPYNAYLHFYELFSSSGIDFELLKLVSKYIIDYRTMLNIKHDYNNFCAIINSPSEVNNIFAVCCYKNIYIKGYSNLLNEYKNDCTLLEIEKKENVLFYLKKIKNTFLIVIEYFKKCRELFLNYSENESDVIDIAGLTELINLNQLNVDNKYDVYSLKNIAKKSNYNVKTIIMEYQNLIDKFSDKVRYFEEEELKELYCLNDLDYDNDANLLVDLILCGAINENFVNYISSPAITKDFGIEENKYIMQINHGLDASDIKINNPYAVIKYLNYKSGLKFKNFTLLDYIINNDKKGDYIEFSQKIFSEFSNIDIDEINFILNYYDKTDKNTFENFIDRLVKNYDFIFQLNKFLKKNSYYLNDGLSRIINILLQKEEYVSSIKKADVIYNSIYNSIFDINFDNKNVVNSLNDLNIKFININKYRKNNFDRVIYENSLYKFNKNNLSFIGMKNFYSDKNIFYKYILNNLDEFYDECYKNGSYKLLDEAIINRVMERTENVEFKKNIIEKEKFNISRLTPDICIDIFKFDRISHKWKYVLPAIKFGFKNELSSFIVKNIDDFKSDKIPKINDVEFSIIFMQKLLKENEIDYFNKYFSINPSNQFLYNISQKMTDKTICFMIDNKLTTFSKQNLKEILRKCKRYYVDIYLYQHWKNKKSIVRFANVLKSVDFVDVDNLLINIEKFEDKCEFLVAMDYNSNVIAEKYNFLFSDKRRKYIIKNLYYKKLFEPNKELFDIKKIDRTRYAVRYKGASKINMNISIMHN